MKKLIVFAGIIASLTACKKVEGEGGRAEIYGSLEIDQILYVNSNATDTVDVIASAEDVYIVYGEADGIYDDKIQTNYDGTFKFKFLQPGTYTIFAYSEIFHKGANLTNNDDDYYTKEVVKKTITLGKKDSFDAGTISLIR